MRKIFLDTNIILDFLGKRKPFYLPAAQVMTLADKKQISLYTSATSITNTYYLLTRYEGRDIALRKLRMFKLLCVISEMNNEVIEKALHSEFRDFEDAVQYYSALASSCDVIITRNEKDFLKSELPVFNAETFLKAFYE